MEVGLKNGLSDLYVLRSGWGGLEEASPFTKLTDNMR